MAEGRIISLETASESRRMFISSNLQNAYARFSKRKIIPGKIFPPECLRAVRILHGIFSFQGWENFLGFRRNTYPFIYRAFYATLHHLPNGSITFNIKDREHHLSKTDFAQILQVPNQGITYVDDEGFHNILGVTLEHVLSALSHRGTELSSLRVKDIIVEAKVVMNIIHHTIFPKARTFEKMSFADLYLYYCILKGIMKLERACNFRNLDADVALLLTQLLRATPYKFISARFRRLSRECTVHTLAQIFANNFLNSLGILL